MKVDLECSQGLEAWMGLLGKGPAGEKAAERLVSEGMHSAGASSSRLAEVFQSSLPDLAACRQLPSFLEP